MMGRQRWGKVPAVVDLVLMTTQKSLMEFGPIHVSNSKLFSCYNNSKKKQKKQM